ncbi:MAG: PIN domain-containing protein [Rubrobacteraceae bacterium]
MRPVIDASTLVAELLRERGHELIADPSLDLYVPAWMWEETRHEVSKRLDIRVSRGLPEPVAARFWDTAERVKEQSVTEVPEELYEDLKDEALARLPRDAKDWPVVALALALGADILTGDEDFFGCGVATWTVETLIFQLVRRGESTST